MLVVELNRENYEYDVQALVKAFFPEEQVEVLIPESRADRREKLSGEVKIRVTVGEKQAEVFISPELYNKTCEPTGGSTATEPGDGVNGGTAAEPGDEVNGGTAAEPGDEVNGGTVAEPGDEVNGGTAAEPGDEVNGGTAAEPGDGAAGVPARTPGSEDAVGSFRWVPTEGMSYKECFKEFIYSTLSRVTGRELPWGMLTGIRPTKIAYGMLEEGRSRRDIVEHYRGKYYVSVEKAELATDIAERERRLLAGVHYEGGYSLYIGIPFCPTTCLYCSFTSFPIAAYRQKVNVYLDCLLQEAEYVAKRLQGKILDSVYIGGGTPTTLEPEQLDRLLAGLRRLFDFGTVQEFTVEAGRADSITEEKLKALYRHGVTRISVNPQTMKQETLDLIGRKASVAQVEEAFLLARRLGFDNINMDIILGLPGENAEDVRHTIDRLAELSPDSLTVHSLAVKRASGLSQWIQENGISMLRNTDETMTIAAEGAERMGLVPYYLYRQKNMSGNFENVGYAREGKPGLYNILIMEEVQTIVALGAGSITKRVYPDGRIERCENVKEVALYIEKIDEMIERKRKLFADF